MMTLGRILVVDDETPVREVLTEYFATEGYDVESAGRLITSPCGVKT